MTSRTCDVLVIGAGAAGLAAARTLGAAGRRVVILEARPRVGGRIFTEFAQTPNDATLIPIEMGADFVHGLPQASWQLINEARLSTLEIDGSALSYQNGQLQSFERNPQGPLQMMHKASEWLNTQPPGTDVSFDDYLQLTHTPKDTAAQARGYVEGFNAADASRMGIAAISRQQLAEDAIEGDRLFHLTAGYSALPEFLSAQFQERGGTLLLGHWVRDIAWRCGRVTARGIGPNNEPFEFEAARLVVTLPLGVLQARAVSFDPMPTVFMAAADRMAMGAVTRMTVLFREGFWTDRSKDLSFLFSPGELIPTWWTAMPDTAPVITAWVGGPRALALAEQQQTAQGSEKLEAVVLNTLATVFDRPIAQLSELLVSSHSHDWSADPFARGAYSYAPAGAVQASQLMTLPAEGTVYFAGEHTDTEGHWGTVHAALNSGYRAASQILAARG